MKGLKHGQDDVAVRNRIIDTPKRPFFKATATALVAGLLYVGTPAAILTIPNKAVAQETEICGRKVEVVKLDKTVAQMDRETAPYREGEFTAEQSVSGGYMISVNIPHKLDFIVTNKGKWMVDVAFAAELDKTGTSGTRRIDLSDFADYVGRVTSQKMERVHIILEFGTFEYQGKNTEYTTAHIYPLNKEGQPIARMKEGDLTFDVSYFDGRITGGEALLVEPSSRRSVIAKHEFTIARN